MQSVNTIPIADALDFARICNRTGNWTPWLAHLGGIQTHGGGTSNATVAPTNARSTANRRTRRKTISTRGTRAGSNGDMLLELFFDNPTASYTATQLRETSPFRNWKPNTVASLLSRFAKSGKLTKNATGGYSLATTASVDKSLGQRRTRARKTVPSADTGLVAATG